jgi:group II intron maturase
MSAADLIDQLNPKIRGWANYHRHVVSKRTFGRVDHAIFSSLWQWARRRHPNKSLRWIKPKYFDRRGNRDWSFFGETCDPSKLSPSESADVALAGHGRNVSNCRNGYDSCDHSNLTQQETIALALADHQQNVLTAKTV